MVKNFNFRSVFSFCKTDKAKQGYLNGMCNTMKTKEQNSKLKFTGNINIEKYSMIYLIFIKIINILMKKCRFYYVINGVK
jgi:hypothetical protein